MRFHFLCLSLVLGLVGCGDFELAPCGWAGCGEGERCVDNACVGCGKSGEVCCDATVGGEHCPGTTLGCDPADGPGTCSKTCGDIGLPCCDGSDSGCDPGSTCNSNTVCENSSGDPCFSGSNAFTFTVITEDCFAASLTFSTETLAEAENCQQQWLPVPPNGELCSVGATPDTSNVCEAGQSFGLTLNHCSAEQLVACEAYYCGDADGDCGWSECP